MEFHLAEIDITTEVSVPPSRFWDGITTIVRADALLTLGNDDLVEQDTVLRLERLADQRDQRQIVILAVLGAEPADPVRGECGHRLVGDRGMDDVGPDDVLGYVVITCPITDNTHRGEIQLTVRRDRRGLGIGSALLDSAHAALRADDRTTATVIGLVKPAPPESGEGVITCPTGTIKVRSDDRDTAFALRHGYSLAMIERHSVQPLPVPQEVLSLALDDTRARAAGYELIRFRGMPAEDLLADIATLFQAMTTDPPLGEVDWRPAVWDVERARHAYEYMTMGQDIFTTAIRHLQSGTLVGYSQLTGPHTRPAVVYQANTIVVEGHRGHGLGLLMKAANCADVSAERPSSRRVHTWNADENDHMLAINTRLGYRVESLEAVWQKVLD